MMMFFCNWWFIFVIVLLFIVLCFGDDEVKNGKLVDKIVEKYVFKFYDVELLKFELLKFLENVFVIFFF